MFVYLDNSSTTKQSSDVTEIMSRTAEETFGNPSSLHRLGVEAEKVLKKARKDMASVIGASPDEIFFTSGGTESDNTAIFGAAEALSREGTRIITQETEHPAVLECTDELKRRGFDVVRVPVGRDGIIDMNAFKNALNDDTILVSVMHVNNETGAVQPVREIGALVKDQGKSIFHCDAVQSFGKLPIDVRTMNVDLISVSGHKIHGPRGTGFLYVKRGVNVRPLIRGGGQERGFRSGTENLPGIAGLAHAALSAERSRDENFSHVKKLSERLIEGIRENVPDVQINGPERDGNPGTEKWLPYIVNVSLKDTRGEVMLHMLEQKGIYVSTGSACSSHKKGFSHVLEAMGTDAVMSEGALRFSLSYDNTEEEMDYTVEVLAEAAAGHRKMMALARRMGR